MTSSVVFAYHDVGVRCLQVLLEHGIDVPLVVSHADDPAEGRWFSSVRNFAEGRGISILEDPQPEPLLAKLRDLRPDLIFSFYYRRMLPTEVLAVARIGAYNMHGSLLPKYRGRAPINWAVLHGETRTGATLHEMVAKPDAGRIVDQEAVAIGPDDQAIDVYRKVVAAAALVLDRSVAALASGRAVLRAQDLGQGSYFGARRPEDGRIDWSWSAARIHNLVRAVAPPYPGAFCDGLRVYRTRIESDRDGPLGSVGPYREGDAWFAICGDGKVLRLVEVEETK
jgi:methionyl-tRNA formyltransferase